MRRTSVLFIGLVVACGPEATPVGESCSGLYGGREGRISPSVDSAVGAAWIIGPPPLEQREFCTFTRVADNWLLTAAHCAGNERATRLALTFEANAAAGPKPCQPQDARPDSFGPTVPVVESILHPYLDLLLLQVELAPGPWLSVADVAALAGESVLMVGYGRQETGTIGLQESLVATVQSAEDGWIVVVAEGNAGACGGDSGGPLLRFDDGSYELLGLLSSGSIDCVKFDSYVELTNVRSWLESSLQGRN